MSKSSKGSKDSKYSNGSKGTYSASTKTRTATDKYDY
jgi:hypothetical protein